VNIPLNVKENDEQTLDFALYFPLGGWLLCRKVITVNPALITSGIPIQEDYFVRGNLTKLLESIVHAAASDQLSEIASGTLFPVCIPPITPETKFRTHTEP
jgi:hypothetical protein